MATTSPESSAANEILLTHHQTTRGLANAWVSILHGCLTQRLVALVMGVSAALLILTATRLAESPQGRAA